MPWTKGEIEALYEQGLSQDSIAARLSISQSTVSRVLRGSTTRGYSRSGENNPNWKGGRRTNSKGYVQVLVQPDDVMAPMRNCMGYIPEHRLVVARAISRPLSEQEQVHHINGDKTDNRLENLQLRFGNHGNGIAASCGDCGSRNIVPDPLD